MSKTLRTILEEVTTSSGIDGLTQATGGGAPMRPIKRDKFSGVEVFEVDGEAYQSIVCGPKHPNHSYAKYVKCPDTLTAIREYTKANPGKPVILKNSSTSHMAFLKSSQAGLHTNFA